MDSSNWFIWFIIIALIASLLPGRPRKMKPVVWLDPAEFVRVAGKSGGKVIRASMRGRWPLLPTWVQQIFPVRYVTEGSDYYYHTYSTEPLSLPESVEVVNAWSFRFW